MRVVFGFKKVDKGLANFGKLHGFGGGKWRGHDIIRVTLWQIFKRFFKIDDFFTIFKIIDF